MIAQTAQIDLGELTDNGRVHSLSGHERGLSARRQFDLDTLDNSPSVVVVSIPRDIDAISPSFFQGLFAQSLIKTFERSPERFFEHYNFDATVNVLSQIERGVASLLIRRPWM